MQKVTKEPKGLDPFGRFLSQEPLCQKYEGTFYSIYRGYEGLVSKYWPFLAAS